MGHGYNGGRNGESDTPWWYFLGGCCACLLGAAAITALIIASINLVSVGELSMFAQHHGHTKPFGEMSINESTPFPFEFNTTCIPLSGFVKNHEFEVVVGGAYIEAPKNGVYWYSVSGLVSFGTHFFVNTPWQLFVSVNGEKMLNEGQARDVAWYSVLNETHFSSIFVNWPFFPHTPADMRMSSLIHLKAGDKLGIQIGFPEFCLHCGLIEQGIHGPGIITVESAQVAIRLFEEDPTSSAPTKGFAGALIFLMVLMLI